MAPSKERMSSATSNCRLLARSFTEIGLLRLFVLFLIFYRNAYLIGHLNGSLISETQYITSCVIEERIYR